MCRLRSLPSTARRTQVAKTMQSVKAAAKDGVKQTNQLHSDLVASRRKLLKAVGDAFYAAKYDLDEEIKKRGADVAVNNTAKEQLKHLDTLLAGVTPGAPQPSG